MPDLSTAELRDRVRRTFGHELSDERAEADRGRWLSMLEAVERLREWEGRLGDTPPAAVHAASGPEDEGGGD